MKDDVAYSRQFVCLIGRYVGRHVIGQDEIAYVTCAILQRMDTRLQVYRMDMVGHMLGRAGCTLTIPATRWTCELVGFIRTGAETQ